MMNRAASPRGKAAQLARLLSAHLGLGACSAREAVAFNPAFTVIVRGILVERTPYKDTYYLWNLYGLFFIRRSFVSLRYSSRITGGAQLEGDIGTVANAGATSVIDARSLEDVNDDDARQTIMRKVAATNNEDVHDIEDLFNLACLRYLKQACDETVGLFAVCDATVNRLLKLSFLRPSDLDTFDQIQRVVTLSRQHPKDLRSFLLTHAKTNARDLGFLSHHSS